MIAILNTVRMILAGIDMRNMAFKPLDAYKVENQGPILNVENLVFDQDPAINRVLIQLLQRVQALPETSRVSDIARINALLQQARART